MGGAAPHVEVDPPVAEEAAAVGDPHLTLTSGSSQDMCCEGGECKPCPVALLQVSDDYYSYYYYDEASLLQQDDEEFDEYDYDEETMLQEDDLEGMGGRGRRGNGMMMGNGMMTGNGMGGRGRRGNGMMM